MNHFHDLIRQNELLEAAKLFEDTALKNESIFLQGKINSLNNKINKGIISQEDATIETNKIREELLSILNHFENLQAVEEKGKNTVTTQVNSLELCPIQGGSFNMAKSYNVSLSDYEIGKYLVTQRLWEEVMGDNPSHFQGSLDLPIENVSWNDIQVFLEKLNQQYPGYNYSLPTEAQWVFAASEGIEENASRYSGSLKIDDVAWYIENSGNKTQAVGLLGQNKWGIHDMSGNVWEWCSDWRGKFPIGEFRNPKGVEKSLKKVIKGGCWSISADFCRIDFACEELPKLRSSSIGFRLAREK